MPSGGRRTGAGRKPRRRNVVPFTAPHETPAPVARAKHVKRIVPPKGLLTRDEYLEWARLAPSAQALGTLTPQTVHGFVLLCQFRVEYRRLTEKIDAEGETYVNSFGELKRHPQCPEKHAVRMRVEQNMARFGLTGDGKTVAPKKADDTEKANPWAVIAKR